jgi:hypothetical protein
VSAPSSELASGPCAVGARKGRAAGPLDLEEILESVRETAYRWDFASDRIDWAANAETVLGIADMAELGKGRAFALRVHPEQGGRMDHRLVASV